MIQSKLNMIEDPVCWVNEEEALFKFPQSSYQDIGDITVKAPFCSFTGFCYINFNFVFCNFSL